ncbi:hypothetical protein HV164_12625 [Citrobacter freundii]|uniref:HEPN AbiU2-like domain-containing protein n=1 Tax=Citrobacter freundii TaxID=546 RepID=A0ABD7AYR1_CITFR|nr:hypothetical protein [Citrobacter freundii]QLY37318.1 hypothetical protein HV164_12625 [Citrobacter freundii]QMA47621.1 hypothetical protein HV030_13950 [Citrobacter freundii]
MLVFPLSMPGVWLDNDDHQWCFNINQILNELKSCFWEANTSLNLFNEEMCIAYSELENGSSSQEFQRDRIRIDEIISDIRLKNGIGPFELCYEVNQRATELLKKEKWENGVEPNELKFRKKFIYAKSFLYSLDCIRELLKVLSNEDNVPFEIQALLKLMDTSFPQLRAVRNSAHHIEDRALGFKRVRGKKVKIELQPVNTGAIRADGGIILLHQLNGTKLGFTMENGQYGEIDVSSTSMETIRVIIQGVFDSFKWKGRPVHLPS